MTYDSRPTEGVDGDIESKSFVVMNVLEEIRGVEHELLRNTAHVHLRVGISKIEIRSQDQDF
jgi:hypothetical protein